ncbi:putative nucleotide-binding alpha-beta plait domain-containing protein [Medicago truncatula]|uniref:Putative nucleotide-binding alpha-beta plait domain-containing protein n=1 Tax=Medicago truncatula TaxID=3880 RepID=G7IHN0_MEDTR|nr:small RNA-binding protein 11, chloroplastic [Medicago truncatula]AES67592.1 RNA-binding (RRM/RBD/RNP motif) family protein [Medicago truncatula]AFK43063.1 unknown [Medicago truncatula]RHN76058.1 putative nucleotide-binding alpha-beta plait domain-containing protein [Medicago truncatula]
MSQRIGTKLFVSRLSFYTTQQQLESLFSPFGVLTEATLITDQNTQRPKGFGFVSYKSEIEAEKARKALNGRIVDGRLIFVEHAKPKDSS